ncbi:MAG: hypothetical protein GYB66_04215 [Chloroflexi bacterium]|nr:hypothetical protein [Chloroflexota bacterium]
MQTPHDVMILYTANLKADFGLLPRLFTLIQQTRQRHHRAPQDTLLLDLGSAWTTQSWICQATENRAPYLVMDAMGYHVIRADGLDVGGIIGLQEVVQARLIDDSVVYRWRQQEVTIHIGPKAGPPCIKWPSDSTPETGTAYTHSPGCLTIYPPHHALGHVTVQWPAMSVQTSEQIPFDRSARPDPSIVAAIEFVESEARYYAGKKRGTVPK